MDLAGDGLSLVSAPRPGARAASFWRFGPPEPSEAARRAAPALAVPGLGLDGRVFGLAAPLAEDRDWILWNPPNEQPYRPTMEDFAADAIAALDAAGHAGRPAVVVGSSFGGMVALAAAAARPERVAALVLVGTGAAWADLRPRTRFASHLVPLVPRRAFPSVFATLMVPASRHGDPVVREALRTQMRHRTRSFVEAAVEAMRGFDARSALAAIRCPALVVHGEADRVFPLAAGKRLARGLPRARLAVLPGCGHLPQATHPGPFRDAVRAFLREAAP